MDEANKVTFEQQKAAEVKERLDRSEAVLRGIWGENFDANMSVLSKYIESQIPKGGDPVAYDKQYRENLSEILQNPVMARSIFNGIAAKQTPAVPPAGTPPWAYDNSVPQADPGAAQGQHQAVLTEWKGLMAAGSPLYSNNPMEREAAIARKTQLDVAIHKMGIQNQLLPSTGFLKGIA